MCDYDQAKLSSERKSQGSVGIDIGAARGDISTRTTAKGKTNGTHLLDSWSGSGSWPSFDMTRARPLL
jgi:hypothetical protein